MIFERTINGTDHHQEAFLKVLDKKTEKDPNSGCWLWTGTTTGVLRYGVFRGRAAHRRSYEASKGAIPAGMYVLHKCDTPQCVNPDHLTAGTHNDNMADMVKKGRHMTKRKSTSRPFLALTA